MADAPIGQGWCWISEAYQVERWACHYIFLFIDMLALPIIYYLTFQLRKRDEDLESSTARPWKEKIPKSFLLYPLAYFGMTITISIARLAQTYGRPVPAGILYFGASIYVCEGACNVFIYTSIGKGTVNWRWFEWARHLLDVFKRIHPKGDANIWKVPNMTNYDETVKKFNPRNRQRLLGYEKYGEKRQVWVLLDRGDECKIKLGSVETRALAIGSIDGTGTLLIATEGGKLYAYNTLESSRRHWWKYLHRRRSRVPWNDPSFRHAEIEFCADDPDKIEWRKVTKRITCPEIDKKVYAERQGWFRKGIQWFEQLRPTNVAIELVQGHKGFQTDAEVTVTGENEPLIH